MEKQRPNAWRLGNARIEKLAILRALQIGDLLCAIPAIRSIRRALPETRIVLIGLPWSRCLIERYPNYFDDFLEFPGYPGLPERAFTAQRVVEFLARAQQARFDLAIQMHGSGAFVNPLTALLGARMSAGYHVDGEWRPDAERFLPYPDGVHEVHRHLRLVEFLGIASDSDVLEFPLYDADFDELASLEAMRRFRHRAYVCVHPGARYPSRRWPAARFAAVAERLAREGLLIVITGAAAEASLAEEVSAELTVAHVNLAGQTSLGALGALLHGARLLISNDTGVSHLAAALRTPSVVVVAGSDAARWAPLDRNRHRIVRHAVECQPCEYTICPVGHPCATALNAATVLRAALELLDAYAEERASVRDAARPRPSLKNQIA